MRLPTLLCAICLLSPLPATALPDPDTGWWLDRNPRIRPTDARVRAALADGLRRSGIVRGLVARIEASDVFVYLGMSPHMPDGLSGRLTFAGDAGRFRYLRVELSPIFNTDQVIAALAHELHHVVEVIDHPEVRSDRTLLTLYQRIGHASRATRVSGWETTAALDVGYDVRRELRQVRAGLLAAGPEAERKPR
jgi:hypothetical protein